MTVEFKSQHGRKATLLALVLLTTAATAVAILSYPFSNWSSVKTRSPDTVIARCTKTPSALEVQGNKVVIGNPHGLWDSDIDILYVLKGRTNLGPARLTSFYKPRQGEDYLVFSIYDGRHYNAVEAYRIVPLGSSAPTNLLSGRSFDEQIRVLLQYRLEMLSREMEQAQEEKNRLEEGLRE
jgi:hypothetical protein